MARGMDPRRSLVAGLIWLVVALATSFAFAASWWAGRVAREIVVQQHLRRLVLETDLLGSDLSQAVDARLAAVRAAAVRDNNNSMQPADIFERLRAADPDEGWIALADAAGIVVDGDGSLPLGTRVAAMPWFSHALRGPWISVIGGLTRRGRAEDFGDLSLPVKDGAGRTVGVIAAHLAWRWAPRDLRRLSASLDPQGSQEIRVLDPDNVVRVGPAALLDRPWVGQRIEDAPPVEVFVNTTPDSAMFLPRFERLPDGATVVIARAPVILDGEGAASGWTVQLSEPKQQVFQRANALATRILWISICLGAATALVGALGARHLTNRLRRLTRSAAAVGRNESARIEVPSGGDEVAQLAAALAKVLGDLQQERRELLTLSSELERRVAVRTREVERLAEEARYAAIVRERLKIARDLHDTLAHSMMAMLSEVRLLRKLQVHEPASLADELARAERVAQEGLNEARTAITQMRLNAVRDTGLGAALAKAFDRFINHTGIALEFTADAAAARFGDERAETLFRMIEEALRNIERHAAASHVVVNLTMLDDAHLRLRIADDGIGFDAAIARPGHYGLLGLREQAHLIEAELRIDSAPQRGTALTVTLRVGPAPIFF